MRRTYTMAEKMLRAAIGLRPAPGLRRYRRPGCRCLTGTRGSTFAHNLSDTVHDLICAILHGIFSQLAPSASSYLPARTKFETIYG